MDENVKLIYFWIKEAKYNCFNNREFCFSNKYLINYIPDISQSGQLSINYKDSVNVFDNLFSDKLSIKANVTAVVGNNGAGKTTLIEEIYDRLDDLKHNKNFNDYILIFETSDKLHVIHHFQEPIKIDSYTNAKRIIVQNDKDFILLNNFSYVLMSNDLKIEGKNLIDESVKDENKIDTIFNGYLNEFFGVKYLEEIEVFESIQKAYRRKDEIKKFLYELVKIDYMVNVFSNKNNKSSFINDLGDFSVNFKLHDFSNYFTFALYSFNNQSKTGALIQGDFILDYFIQNLFQELISYIILKEVNKDYIKSIDKILDNHSILFCNHSNKEYIENQVLKSIPPMTEANNIFIYYNDCDSLLACINNICEIFKGSNKVITYFFEVAKCMKLLSTKTIPLVDGYYEIKISDLRSLDTSKHKNIQFYFLKFIDDLRIGMSSGENKFITMLSQLYFLKNCQDLYPKLKKVNKNTLIIIDELDAFLHPEWQRTILYKILVQLKEQFDDHNFQIIFTTHSPIILSDIPRENCILIKKGMENNILNYQELGETFGQNIYVLYENAFFLDNGFVGEFSKSFIKMLHNHILENNALNLIKNKKLYLNYISVIGEPLIRNQLLSILNSKITNYDYRKERIEDLIKLRDKLESEIISLKAKEDSNVDQLK